VANLLREQLRCKLLTAAIACAALLACFSPARGQSFAEDPLASFKVKAPDFPKPGFAVSGTTWLNSPPLTLEKLRGKVVMIDFWEYTCINCIRTFPQNKKWYKRYHKYGFEIIGVHDPEFQIAYDVNNVRAAVQRFGLPYPIVVDDKYAIWSEYGNQAWPSRFLIDANGYARYHIDGEGDDRNFEKAIRKLLVEAHPGLKFPASYTLPARENAMRGCDRIPTPEMYVGPWEGRGIVANHNPYHPGQKFNYEMPKRVNDGRAGLSGPWETDKNGMIFAGKPQEPEQQGAARLRMQYHARELYAVMNVWRGVPEELYILQDGKYLTSANKGADVKIDAQGRSYINVDSSRMYYLVSNPKFGKHTVDLIPTVSGIMIDSFTFGNSCQTKFPHV
jgi:thiol-disulfide isomerase/thioredoxin